MNYVCQVFAILTKFHQSYISASLYAEIHKQFLHYPYKVTAKDWTGLFQIVRRSALNYF